jgi:hypothetical protein
VRDRLAFGIILAVLALLWLSLPLLAVVFVWEPLFGNFIREHETIVQTLVVVGSVWFLLKSYNDDLAARLDKIDKRLFALERSDGLLGANND